MNLIFDRIGGIYKLGTYFIEKEMATHSSILAWEISWTEDSGQLQSMGLQRVGPEWSGLACIGPYLKDVNVLIVFTVITYD